MKRIFATIISSVIGLSFLCSPAMATNHPNTFGAALGENKVSILKDCANEPNGEDSIKCVLKHVVDILSVLIGILGVIGITITGIQYLTAGGSEEKTRKAKRRMLEIVIGLAAYAVMYSLLSWILPNTKTSPTTPTTTVTSTPIPDGDTTKVKTNTVSDPEECIESAGGWSWDNEKKVCWRPYRRDYNDETDPAKCENDYYLYHWDDIEKRCYRLY